LADKIAYSSGVADDSILQTERLILRRWRESDRGPFARINADPRVMEFMPRRLSEEENDQIMEGIEAAFSAARISACARLSCAGASSASSV